MTAYAALLRAVNVGGTGKLPMAELKRMGEEAGFEAVRTYIASGNLIFKSAKSEAAVKAALEKKLAEFAGKAVPLFVRTAEELASIAAHNPFPKCAPNRIGVYLMDAAPPKDALEDIRGRKDEELEPGKREIYVHFPDGMGQSKLRIPAAEHGTVRNMNTIAKLAELAAKL